MCHASGYARFPAPWVLRDRQGFLGLQAQPVRLGPLVPLDLPVQLELPGQRDLRVRLEFPVPLGLPVRLELPGLLGLPARLELPVPLD